MIVAVLIGLGIGYGILSAIQNRNPFYEPGAPAAPWGAAWAWQPSPIWLPSYLLCVVPENGYGTTRTRSGYMFRGPGDRNRYMLASVAIGGVFGVFAAGGWMSAQALWSRARAA